MAVLWLAAVLLPVCCVLAADRDTHPPIENVRMEPGRKRLTWNINGNVSSIECLVNSSSLRKAKNNRYCLVHVLPKCEVKNYTVHVTLTSGELFTTWIQYPQQEGNPRAAAEQLECRVHDLDFLTCSWAVGREAPRDVQYDFYVEDVNANKMWLCPRYTKKGPGTHIQCQFDDVSQFVPEQDDQNHLYRFVVNGTSKEARIPCSEILRLLPEIEELVAPKLSANCNRSLASMEWEMFSHFEKTFRYELEIQKGSDAPFTQTVFKNSWMLTNPGTFTVTIRAKGGQWSAPQRFVCDHEDGARLHIWLIAPAMLLGVGTAALLCKKCSVLQKLFPPIPHVKDPTGDLSAQEKMVAWQASRPAQEDCPVAEVQLVKGA